MDKEPWIGFEFLKETELNCVGLLDSWNFKM